MKSEPRILIVDDDDGIASLLRDYLTRFGMTAEFVHDAAAMRQRMSEENFDMLVLDLMLPGTDGFAIAREIRAASSMPIIMLTARSDPHDRIIGLEIGADDYIGKPFEPRELVARIHTVLRRTRSAASLLDAARRSHLTRFDGWQLDLNARQLTSPAGLNVALSNAEFRLLLAFLEKPRHLRSRDQLMEQARGKSMDSFDRSIDLLVSRLRQKLSSDPSSADIIKTVRGAGYMFTAQNVHNVPEWRQ